MSSQNLKHLRVLLYQSPTTPFYWAAQGIEHDIGRQGSTMGLCIERFISMIDLNLRIGAIEKRDPADAQFTVAWQRTNDRVVVRRSGFCMHFGRRRGKKDALDLPEPTIYSAR